MIHRLLDPTAPPFEKTNQLLAADLEQLCEAGLQIFASLEMPHVLAAALQAALRLGSPATSARIHLAHKTGLQFGAALWSDGELRLKDGPSPTAADYNAFQTGETIHNKSTGVKDDLLCLPLNAADNRLGVLSLNIPAHTRITPRMQTILERLARQTAFAIQNAAHLAAAQQRAYTDALTDLPNRRAFDARLQSEVRRASRYQHPFTLLLLDLDGFKGINDQHGHPAGDQVLQKVSACLRSALRDTDFLARYGGDEFAAILPETTLETAQALAARMKEALAGCTLDLPDPARNLISLSLGMAFYPQHAITPQGLLSAADQSLYREKASHKALFLA